jgi:signal transduction histidine kinase
MAHLKLMTEQGQRMQNLIDDMLTLSRLESIDYPLRPKCCVRRCWSASPRKAARCRRQA